MEFSVILRQLDREWDVIASAPMTFITAVIVVLGLSVIFLRWHYGERFAALHATIGSKDAAISLAEDTRKRAQEESAAWRGVYVSVRQEVEQKQPDTDVQAIAMMHVRRDVEQTFRALAEGGELELSLDPGAIQKARANISQNEISLATRVRFLQGMGLASIAVEFAPDRYRVFATAATRRVLDVLKLAETRGGTLDAPSLGGSLS